MKYTIGTTIVIRAILSDLVPTGAASCLNTSAARQRKYIDISTRVKILEMIENIVRTMLATHTLISEPLKINRFH